MSIRSEAEAARSEHEAEEVGNKQEMVAALVESAAAVVYDKLFPLDAAILTVSETDADSGLVVFSDGTDSIGVVEGQVFLVEGSGKEWSKETRALSSLAELGEWFEEHPDVSLVKKGRA